MFVIEFHYVVVLSIIATSVYFQLNAMYTPLNKWFQIDVFPSLLESTSWWFAFHLCSYVVHAEVNAILNTNHASAAGQVIILLQNFKHFFFFLGWFLKSFCSSSDDFAIVLLIIHSHYCRTYNCYLWVPRVVYIENWALTCINVVSLMLPGLLCVYPAYL